MIKSGADSKLKNKDGLTPENISTPELAKNIRQWRSVKKLEPLVKKIEEQNKEINELKISIKALIDMKKAKEEKKLEIPKKSVLSLNEHSETQKQKEISEEKKIEMFNACAKGDFDKVKALYAEGVLLNLLHPYNNANLLIVAMNQGSEGKTNEYDGYYCREDLMQWLFDELIKNKQFKEVYEAVVLVDNPSQRSQYDAKYNKRILDLSHAATWRYRIKYAGKSLRGIFDAMFQAVAGIQSECAGQTSSREYHYNLNRANNGLTLFKKISVLLENAERSLSMNFQLK